MSTGDVEVLDASRVEPDMLDSFLNHAFSPAKFRLLHEYGVWCHRGNQNRFAIVKEDRVVAYAGIIPTTINLRDRVVSAAWYVDLFVHQDYRGQRLQRHLDARIKESAELLLGVPNEVAINIHQKNGWGVRDDYHVFMLPLKPSQTLAVGRNSGWREAAIKLAMGIASPLASLCRNRLLRRDLHLAWRIPEPDAVSLAGVFEAHRNDWITTNRDAAHIRWRYIDSPHRSELSFYVAGRSKQEPVLVAVTRTLRRGNLLITRILDIFGDLTERKLLAELITLVSQEAARSGAVQVTAVSTNLSFTSVLRAQGFILRIPFRFCWFSMDKSIMDAVAMEPCHWCYGDSDTDYPM